MANIKNFGLVGIGTDVQFGKGGAKIVQTAGTFQAKNAAGNAFVRFQIADGADAGDAVTFGQLTNAIASVGTNANAILSEINAIETSVGLGTDGTFIAPTGSNYLNNSTTVMGALGLLDTALFAEANARAAADAALLSNIASIDLRVSDLQDEVDVIESSVGLGTDGTLTLAAGNYLANATSIVEAVETLDGAIKTVSDVADAANATALAANAAAVQNAADIANTAANVVTLSGRTDALESTANALTTRVVDLEANVATIQGEIVTIDSRLDALENDETSANAIAQLQQGLSNETNARVAADAALASDISNTNAAVANAFAAITQEVSDRANAVAQEANARTQADAILTSDLANTTADLADLSANAVLKDGSVAFTGALDMGNNVIHNVADPVASTDAANKQWVLSQVSSLGNAFNYVGVLANAGVDAASAFDLTNLPAGGQNAGDYYKVTNAGYFTDGTSTAYFNANDGLVFNTAGGFDKIDNTDSVVTGTTGEVVVTGSVDTGFVVAIDAAYTTARQQEVSNEANARAAADSALSNAVAQEVSNRSNAVAAVAADIANTNANVATLSATLTQAVSDEANSRVAADAVLSNAIGNTNANVAALDVRVTALENDGTSANAIAQLQQGLSNETNARVAADTALASDIANTNADVAQAVSDAANAVALEANARAAADSALSNAIALEANARTSADAVLTSDLANVAANVAAVSGLVANAQAEIDAIEAGAGLGTDGAYTANATANYINAATSLYNADLKLDAAIKAVADDLATLSQDTIQTADGLNSVHVLDQKVETKLNVNGNAVSVMDVVATANTNSKLTVDFATPGEVQLRASGQPTDVDLRLIGQGAGHVIIGDTGAGFIQADDTYDMTVAGGDNGGNLNLYGETVKVGAADGTAVAQFVGAANATTYATVTNGTDSVEFGAAGTGSNLDIVFAPKGTGSVDVSSARVVNVANAVAATDAANLGQVQAAVAAAEVGHAKTISATITETNGAVTVGNVTGMVARIKVVVTGAFQSGVSITVGSASGTANELAGASDIDEGAAGIYIVETAKDYVGADIQVTVSGATSGSGSAKVYVEYVKA